MRKRIISVARSDTEPCDNWLNLDALAEVEITSEDAAYPIENALLPGQPPGWRAAGSGAQTIRLLFAQPQALRRIWMHFAESDMQRTQEFVLRWSPDGGRSFHDVVRQQWNFNPEGVTCEIENYRVELSAVTVLELTIHPDISASAAVASLVAWRLA